MILMACPIAVQGRAVSVAEVPIGYIVSFNVVRMGSNKKSWIYAFTLWILVYKNTESLNRSRCPCPSSTHTDIHINVRDVLSAAHFSQS